MLWLAAYLTGFPPVGLHAICWTHGLAPMWSGLYLISTRYKLKRLSRVYDVSMPSRAYTSFLLFIWSTRKVLMYCVNALSGLYLISTTLDEMSSIDEVYSVSMPSRAYTSFLRYPFKNLGFMRFPEPVFAGIYQNILTTAVLRAC